MCNKKHIFVIIFSILVSFLFNFLGIFTLFEVWSCFSYWICRSIIFKLWLKSRDLYSSSQVPGSPCGQELAIVGPQSLRLIQGTWAQAQLATGQPIRGQHWVTLTNQRPALGDTDQWEASTSLRSAHAWHSQQSSSSERSAWAWVASGHQLLGQPQLPRGATQIGKTQKMFMTILIIIISCETNLAGAKMNISKRFMRFLNEIFLWHPGSRIPGYTGPGGLGWA